jgi:hypothetical protein
MTDRYGQLDERLGLIADLAERFYQAAQDYTMFGLPWRWSQLPHGEQEAWRGMARVAIRHIDRSVGLR